MIARDGNCPHIIISVRIFLVYPVVRFRLSTRLMIRYVSMVGIPGDWENDEYIGVGESVVGGELQGGSVGIECF